MGHSHDNVALSQATIGQIVQELGRRGANGWLVFDLEERRRALPFFHNELPNEDEMIALAEMGIATIRAQTPPTTRAVD